MYISEVLKPENINLSLTDTTKESALDTMSELLYKNGVLTDKDSFLKDVLDRESISTTGIGNAIAIPHGKSVCVKETTAAIGRLKAPVEWESVDDKPVSVIVLLAVNDNDKSGNHVRLLSQIARKLVSEEVCKKLSEAKDSDEIIKIFSE